MPTKRSGRTRKPSARALALHDAVVNSKLKQGFALRKRGIFQAEALAVLCRKLGITDKELREVSAKSLRHNRDLAARFDERTRRAPRPNHEAIITELSRASDFSPDFPLRTADWPAPGWTTVPPQGGATRNLYLHAEGTGDRLLTSTVFKSDSVTYVFDYTPSFGGVYFLRAPFFAVGPFFVVADDGLCEDKYAQCGVGVSMGVALGASVPGGGPNYNVHYVRVTNEAISDRILFGYKMSLFYLPLTAGVKITVYITLTTYVKVAGNGSIATVDLSNPAGTIWCPHLEVGGLQISWQ